MNTEEFARALEANIDGIAPGSLGPDTELAALDGWDSLAVLTSIALIEEAYGRVVSGEAIRACRTVADLHRLGVGEGS